MIQTEHWFFYVFLALYIAYISVELLLNLLNIRHIDQHKSKIPALFINIFSTDEYQKSISYTKTKTYFNIVQLLYQTAILWIFIMSGAFHEADLWLSSLITHHFLESVIYPFVIMSIFYLANIPFSIYFQFIIEERFGFNRTTLKTFLGDQLKSMFLGLVLGLPLLSLLFWTVREAGSMWWLYGFVLLMGFQLLTAAIFPVVLAPLFYKFVPLADGELKDKITTLARDLKFKMAGIFTIDGSKRSSHSNAFFAGLGKTRRIVLFDTLINKQTTPEIVSVIAHEMGHNIKNHIQKGLVLSSATTLLSMYVLSLCLNWLPFFQIFGVLHPSTHVGFVLFALFSSVFVFPFGPLFQLISRKNEFEADRFSVETVGDKENMISALVKLSKDNLSNLTPHPWYSFYHYSHPTTIERVDAINDISLPPLNNVALK